MPKIHCKIVYKDNTPTPYCFDCTENPQLAVSLAQQTGSTTLIAKHNNTIIDEIHLIWSDGATAPFTLGAAYLATLDPRIGELSFVYLSGAGMSEPSAGGMIWSRANNTLTFVFHPLGEVGVESTGMWNFNPTNMPPVRLKVIVARKTDYACP